jgi:class 3 adenylate cyclase
MSVAAIACFDDELDVFDSCAVAYAAARDRLRLSPALRAAITVGDVELGDPLGLARVLGAMAPAGSVLVTDAVRRVVPDPDELVDVGCVSLAGFVERVRIFELVELLDDKRERTIAAIDLVTNERSAVDLYDRRIFEIARTHRGLVERSNELLHVLSFAAPLDALDALLALDGGWDPIGGRLKLGVDHGNAMYLGGRWFGRPYTHAERLAKTFGGGNDVVATTRETIERFGDLASRNLEETGREEIHIRGMAIPLVAVRLRRA